MIAGPPGESHFTGTNKKTRRNKKKIRAAERRLSAPKAQMGLDLFAA
jgi:hypothetical protein